MAEEVEADNPKITTLDDLCAELRDCSTDSEETVSMPTSDEKTATDPTVKEGDSEYPLPEKAPVKFTGVDVVVMPMGYKSEYPKPETEDSKPLFSDSLPAMKLDLDSAKETDGVFSVPVTIANAKHIYDYDGLKVRKPFDELKASAAFADGIPITREHPPAGIVTDRRQVLGFLKNPLAEDDILKGILAITDKDLIADVKDKKLTEVSPGFFCDLDDTQSGELGSEHFDATQTNIFLNHVAVVENGRCSIEDGCGISLDAKKYPVPSELVNIVKAAIERAKAMKDKSLLNMLEELRKGISVKKDSIDDSNKAVIDAFSALQEETNTLKADLEGFARAETDSLTDEVSVLQDAKVVLDYIKDIKVERDTLRSELGGIVQAEKDSLVDELTLLQDAKSESDLSKLSLDELKNDLNLVKELKAGRLSFPETEEGTRGAGQKVIDDAYSKIQ